jgi:Ni,Fe-hydrogenase I small subunit
MTPEEVKLALTELAEETAKKSLTVVAMGHATAVAGIAAALPAPDAKAIIDHVIGMLTEARDTIGDMK